MIDTAVVLGKGGTSQTLTLINKHMLKGYWGYWWYWWYWSVTDHDQQRRLEQMTQGSKVVDVELKKSVVPE
ncbi:hypothetical protein DPMN_184777 [Dreissena polymorpha]|uniref:Uncharacterized protein n=1 Tax=Dreissena polymorpha TaxID=45954 RepID=A0A9D4DIJ1_DREPO|nr:hypothetical protein DPMN_184777 [Dreissena polymorpha]